MKKILCKRCSSSYQVKSGMMYNKQRYKCKKCNFHYTLGDNRLRYSITEKLMTLSLFKKVLSLRSIASIIGTNNVTILQWIRNIGSSIKEKLMSQPVEESENLDIIEIDEMWHYFQKNSSSVKISAEIYQETAPVS